MSKAERNEGNLTEGNNFNLASAVGGANQKSEEFVKWRGNDTGKGNLNEQRGQWRKKKGGGTTKFGFPRGKWGSKAGGDLEMRGRLRGGLRHIRNRQIARKRLNGGKKRKCNRSSPWKNKK